MKRQILTVLVFITFAIPILAHVADKSAVTFLLNGGRFGDNIMNYIKSKFIAQQHGFDFYLRPFPACESLKAYDLEKIFTKEIEDGYKNKRVLISDQEVFTIKDPTLIISKFSTIIKAHNNNRVDRTNTAQKKLHNLYGECIADCTFGNEIKKMIEPRVSFARLSLPPDKITVAVHIRKGSGPDGKLSSTQIFQEHHHLVEYEQFCLTRQLELQKFYVQEEWKKDLFSKSCITKNRNPYHIADKGNHEIKFPPEQFYIDQIKLLSEMLDHPPMYVYIFTDFNKPEILVKKFENIINLPNITFDSHNQHAYNRTLIDDYGNMACFDCLIRPDSSFSKASQFLGDHSIIIYPKASRRLGNKLIMNKVIIIHCN